MGFLRITTDGCVKGILLEHIAVLPDDKLFMGDTDRRDFFLLVFFIHYAMLTRGIYLLNDGLY